MVVPTFKTTFSEDVLKAIGASDADLALVTIESSRGIDYIISSSKGKLSFGT